MIHYQIVNIIMIGFFIAHGRNILKHGPECIETYISLS